MNQKCSRSFVGDAEKNILSPERLTNIGFCEKLYLGMAQERPSVGTKVQKKQTHEEAIMLSTMTKIWGISGQETNVSDYIIEQVKDYADSIVRDAMGNLIVMKKGYGENRKRIMAAAHMDEIGLCVLKIMDNGFLKVRQIGGVSPHTSYMNRVVFKNGTYGTVGSTEPIQNVKAGEINKLYIDIGAADKEEAEKYVKVGDCAVFCADLVPLAGRNVMAKAFDDRVACYIQVEALKQMKTPYHDVYFVFTVQEEIGLFGAVTSAERVQPDLGIAVDVTGSFDIPGVDNGNAVLGKGAAIKMNDASVLCDVEMVEAMIQCAKDNEIAYQLDSLAAGGTDAGGINRSNAGVKAVGISIPTRYCHAPNSIVNLDDVDACIALLKAYTESELNIVTEEVFK